jgi:hypothetical protein
MDYAVSEVKAEAEAEAAKLQEQIRALRQQLSDAKAQNQMDRDLARQSVAEDMKVTRSCQRKRNRCCF